MSDDHTPLVFVDLSHSISDGDMPYPGDPPTQVIQWATLETEHFRLKQLSFGSHSSTHIDSPSHLIDGGSSLDSIHLSSFFHTAFVIDCKDFPLIGKEQVKAIPSGVTAVLFSTGWSERWNSVRYFEDPPLLTEEATLFLLERGVRMFGFDSSSCDELENGRMPIHHLILSYGALILENLCNLDRVVGKSVSLVALPLLIGDSDGAPARVVASYLAGN